METYDWGTKLFQWLFSYHIVFYLSLNAWSSFSFMDDTLIHTLQKLFSFAGSFVMSKGKQSTFSFFLLLNIWASCEEISLNLSYHSWVALSWGSHRHNGKGRLLSNEIVTNLSSTKATVRNLRLIPKMAAKRHNTCFCDVPLHLLI